MTTKHTCRCTVCGEEFKSVHHRNRICSDKCRREQARVSKELYRYRVANGLVRDRRPLEPRTVAPRVATPRRAPTLAACDDTPAVMAARDSMLTGAAAATMQATSGGRIGVV